MLSGTLALRAAALLVVCASPATLLSASDSAAATDPTHRGYYRDPAVHGDTVVFTSEGDLWSASLHGGPAHRLTSGTGTEAAATISPDGQTIAFSAAYEGPTEVYTIPLAGGLPQRRTWDGDALPAGWSPDGRLLVRTTRFSTLPDPKLELLGAHGERDLVPLATASEGAFSADGRSVFFTRFDKQFSFTKRYKGGWNQSLWRFDGHSEAVPLTSDYAGTSHNPLVWKDRVYFLSDRDGVMNVWSIDPAGHDAKQISHQHGFDITSASVSDGHIVYACGADLWSLDLSSGHEEVIPITLVSDFDQLREHWVKKPLDYVTSTHIAPDGSRAVFTARGEVFTLPLRDSRIVRVAGDSALRFREARFMPDGKSIVALSTGSGETEFWKYPANGEGKPEQLTHNATVLRWEGVPSPDGHWLAHHNKDQQLWIYDTRTKQDKQIAASMTGDFSDLSWSPDSRWLAFVENASNQFAQTKILNLESREIHTLTSDRYNSMNPVWSSDGKWLYFLSDRALKTTVSSPWGSREPEPHFDRPVKIYELALTPGLRSPFLPPDELHPDEPAKDDAKPADPTKPGGDPKLTPETRKATGPATPADKPASDSKAASEPKPIPEVKIDFVGIEDRLSEVPVPPGNLQSLAITDKRLCWMNSTDEPSPKQALQCLDLSNKGDDLDTIMPEIKGFEVSLDRKKLLVRRNDDFFILDSDIKPASLSDPKTLAKAQINLSQWTFSTYPRQEFHGIFLDAWRLERDYFYDRRMQGVNWVNIRDRYLPLVDRVSDRDELNDLISQMVSELGALHTFVGGGDRRQASDKIDLATLGASLHRDQKAGGYTVDHIYLHDPDLPDTAPPFARPDSTVREGETVVAIDGTDLLSVYDERELLRGKAGKQVLLRVKSRSGDLRDLLVRPIKSEDEDSLRYTEWELSRRRLVESVSSNHIGYVHLRAMGSDDINQWAREYYPIFNRQGLIIDVRHNQGGNIDSWLLSKLLRQAWFFWQPRVGDPQWNMQDAFRGHIVVLCDQATASDGEAFAEGFHRFHMGPVIGTRTWGGEIWLSGSNRQADNGVATAAETGVYGPEGKWLIEGHGVDPDIVVDNLPHASNNGDDAQLTAALDLLKKQISDDPRPVPKAPPYPDKSFKY